MRFLILSFLFAFNAFAAEWNELEMGKSYKLIQNFQLQQIERSEALLDFSKGDSVVLKEVNSLDTIKVMVYVFAYDKCPGTELKTDMKIIPVQGTAPMIEVGAELANCNLSLYIETKDIYSKSLIE